MSENHIEACSKCGGKMDEGRVPKGLNWFSGYKSTSQKHFSFEINFERAKACLDCGYVELYLDPEKLRGKLESQGG